jgi:hypothetical protein
MVQLNRSAPGALVSRTAQRAQLGARAKSLPFEPRWNGFWLMPGAEFVCELPDALGAVLRHEDRDLAQLPRSQGSRRGPALAHQRASAAEERHQAAPEICQEIGNAEEDPARASDRATVNMQKVAHISLNSLLPWGVLINRPGPLPSGGALTTLPAPRSLARLGSPLPVVRLP